MALQKVRGRDAAPLTARHSFCIGAATTAEEASLEDSIICLLEWWNGNAFHCYI